MAKANKRLQLKMFRVSQYLSQKQIAERLNYSVSQYSLIERGYRDGSQEFWNTLQREFNIADSEMWRLMKR